MSRNVVVALAAIVVVGLALRHQLIVGLVAAGALMTAAAWVRWAYLPQRTLPRNRARHLRMRLRLRLHPGPGHATVAELHLRWGRLASYRESARTRPSLSRWQRLSHPAEHSFVIGRAHHRHALRVPVQEHAAVIGPPRSYKTALLSRIAMDAPGPVVSTSSKPDLFALTSGVRAARGPVWVFNPQAIGAIPSNVRWSPLEGCLDPAIAIRRADAFARAVSLAGTDDATFWSGKASDGLRGLFAAAALAATDMRKIARWIGSDTEVAQAVAILDRSPRQDWASSLAELTGAAEKTAATVRMVMSRALAFLADPNLAWAVTPPVAEQFDIDQFLVSGGTLYLIARGNGEESVLAPLFAALASEIQHRATQLASRMPGGRLDPPLAMILDEVTQICPVPLPSWLADSGGQGITVVSAFHGIAQLRARWKDAGAQTVIDTSGVRIFLPGLADIQTLRVASELSGHTAWAERGDGTKVTRHEVMSPDMVRQIPAGFALVLRAGYAPVIARLARGWQHKPYRKLRRAGRHIADITSPADRTASEAPEVIDGAGLMLAAPPTTPQDLLPAGAASSSHYPWSAT